MNPLAYGDTPTHMSRMKALGPMNKGETRLLHFPASADGVKCQYSSAIGLDDWDTVLRNPMLQREALSRLTASGGRLAADTTGVWTLRTNLIWKNNDDTARNHLAGIVNAITKALNFKPVFSHFVNIQRRAEDYASSPENCDFTLYQDADGCSVYIASGVEGTGSTLLRQRSVQWVVNTHGMKASVEAFLTCLNGESEDFKYVGDVDADGPVKTTIHAVRWNPRASDTSINDLELVFPSWAEQRINYTPDVQSTVDRLLQDPLNAEQGRLLIFHGSPGTGKTWFLRTLMHEWRDSYTPIIVQDVEFFMSDESYWAALFNDIRNLDDLHDKRPLIILEDAGQGLIRNGSFGSIPIQRLLNRTDGLCIGDYNITFIITFNEDIGQIDPAVVRAGRCREKIHFTPLCRSDAAAWLDHHECAHLIPALAEHTTLADLYALKRGDSVKTTDATSRVSGGFGFAEGGRVCTE